MQTPFTINPLASELPLTLGHSLDLPTDDASSWPHLYDRVASPEEDRALRHKLQGLRDAADALGEKTTQEGDALAELRREEPEGVLVYRLPALLLETLERALREAEHAYGEGDEESAVAHARLGEVLLRLAGGWDYGRYENREEGRFGMAVGEVAEVVVSTEVVTGSSAGRPYEEVRRKVTVLKEG